MVVGQDREATLAAELGTAHNDGFARYPRNVEVPGVSLANLVVAVGIRQLPVGIGQPHPLVLLSQVQELPASLPFRLILLGIIREGVQIFVFSLFGQLQQGVVDVVAVPLPGHDEMHDAEVLALNHQRAPGRRQSQLVHRGDVVVQDPGFLLMRVYEQQVCGREVQGARQGLAAGAEPVK